VANKSIVIELMEKLIEDLSLSTIDDGENMFKISLSPEHCRIPLTQPIDEVYSASDNLNNNLGEQHTFEGIKLPIKCKFAVVKLLLKYDSYLRQHDIRRSQVTF
jgi:hypothetical protein